MDKETRVIGAAWLFSLAFMVWVWAPLSAGLFLSLTIWLAACVDSEIKQWRHRVRVRRLEADALEVAEDLKAVLCEYQETRSGSREG